VANRLYDGTSAYKIEEYESYRDRVQENHETRKNRKVKHVAINHRKLMIITGVVFAVAVAFLYANVVLIQTATRHDKLVNDIQDMRDRNTQVSFEIASAVDLAEVEAKAKNEFGMQQPESHQNVYINVVQSDYSEAANATPHSMGAVEKMISGLKSFLSYIS